MSDQAVTIHIRPDDQPRAYIPHVGTPWALLRLDSEGQAHVVISNLEYLRALIEQLSIVEAGLLALEGSASHD